MPVGIPAELETRHPATVHLLKWLVPNPNLDGIAMTVSVAVWQTALDLVMVLHDGPELSAGLRKLTEAKDCLVRQSLDDRPESAARF